MSNINTNPEHHIDRTPLENPPVFTNEPIMDEMLNFTRFLTIEDQDINGTYCWYLTYRVQRDLYEVIKECDPNCSLLWEDFVTLVRSHHVFREKAVIIARKAVLDFVYNTYFNFEDANWELPFDDENLAKDDDIISCSTLFTPDMAQALIDCILLRIEIVQYSRQINKGKDYSWEEFLVELPSEHTIWDEIICAFRDALGRLDFKPAWLHEVKNMPDPDIE